MKYVYTFKNGDKSKQGKGFEMAIKEALSLANARKVSPQGKPDFRYRRKCYDVKQNGTVIKYAGESGYIKGASRVIYATHIAYEVLEVTETHTTIKVNLADTEMFVVDRNAFVKFLKATDGMTKTNKEGTEVNIQTQYSYTKSAYHGKKWKALTEWLYENDIGDDVIGEILANA